MHLGDDPTLSVPHSQEPTNIMTRYTLTHSHLLAWEITILFLDIIKFEGRCPRTIIGIAD